MKFGKLCVTLCSEYRIFQCNEPCERLESLLVPARLLQRCCKSLEIPQLQGLQVFAHGDILALTEIFNGLRYIGKRQVKFSENIV